MSFRFLNRLPAPPRKDENSPELPKEPEFDTYESCGTDGGGTFDALEATLGDSAGRCGGADRADAVDVLALGGAGRGGGG